MLPQLVSAFTQRHPEARLEVHELTQDQLTSRLESGDLDLAIMYDLDLAATWAHGTLAHLRPRVVLPATHRLAEDAGPVDLSHLRKDPMVLLDAPPSGSHAHDCCARAGFTPRVAYRTRTYETARSFVSRVLAPAGGVVGMTPAEVAVLDDPATEVATAWGAQPGELFVVRPDGLLLARGAAGGLRTTVDALATGRAVAPRPTTSRMPQWCRVQWCRVQWCRVQWCRVQWCRVQWCRVQWCRVQWLRRQRSSRLRSRTRPRPPARRSGWPSPKVWTPSPPTTATAS
ncbi:LysR substrate-binding domain-containing protein [Nocardioides daphniae]|uniref:LysR substrate-binding domain-containing protein n=1 Tax=Nocardioides daphniae TaxID=402297 RepID=UPI0019310CEF|nr:LysR substrate-binding domain-containing protein [Nocardioides daphniae]